MSWQLRTATEGDLDAIMAIENRVFPEDAWSTATMRAELRDGNGAYLVATPVADPSRVDAYGGVRAPSRQPQADIQTIAVAENARRHGLGRLLMLHMIDIARQRGADELFLEVRDDNQGAQALYASLGFERIAVRPRYYNGTVDAVIMRLTIPEPKAALA